MNPFLVNETYQLLKVVKHIDEPSTFLSNVFFPERIQTYSDVLALEYSKSHRRLAPYLVKGSRALNMTRDKSKVALYKAPMIGCRRTLTLDDISRRMIGEMPMFSERTPQERALEMQTLDLEDLTRMMVNRREQMAAELLTTGKLKIRAFAEDGSITDDDTIIFDEDYQITPSVAWSNPAATIYDDLKAVCEFFGENSDALPDICICGKNVERYLLNNNEIRSWFEITNRNNLAMASFAPQYTSPQARYLGKIDALGLEFHSYTVTYFDDLTGEIKPYIPDNCVIIGRGGAGKFLFGRVDLLQNGTWTSYAAEMVPYTTYNDEAQTSSITLYSRCCPLPNVIESIRALKVA